MENEELEILLVEDNPQDAEMTIRTLKKNKLANNIVHLKDGEEALNFLFGKEVYSGRDINNKPKLILLDLKMPKVDGLEVLGKIKTHENLKIIPVVIMTSSKEDPDIKKCYELGVNSYIVKPVDFDKFIKVIADLGIYWLLYNQPPV